MNTTTKAQRYNNRIDKVWEKCMDTKRKAGSGDDLVQCDPCGRMVPREETITRIYPSAGETTVCGECRGEKSAERIEIALIKGVEGHCVAINDYRVCGPKPWGGGSVTQSWKATKEDVLRAFLTPDQKHAWLDHELQVVSTQSYTALVEALKLFKAMDNCNYDLETMRRSGLFEQVDAALKAAGEE